jgi:hypothetical protein
MYALQHLLLLLQLHVVLLVDIRETPLLRHDDLLAAGELVPSPTERLHNHRGVIFLRTDREDNLANIYTGDGAVWLSPCATHTSLEPTPPALAACAARVADNEPIGAGTWQHLVDTDDVERMSADSQVEGILARCLGNVFVGADTTSFQSLAGQLFVLVGDKVSAEGEFIDVGTFASEIENTDLF